MINLRPYQNNAISNLRASIGAGNKRVILQASTGAGKTIVACEMIRLAVAKSKRVLFIAHRKEIINQSSQKLDDFGLDHGIVMASNPRKNDHAVQVASIQTLMRRDKPDADLIIIDEAHLSCSASYKSIVEHYAGATVIGLTATPIRGDGKGLGEVYGDIVSVVPMSQLIADGHLVKPRVFAPFVPNMKKVRISKGDYDAAETAAIMDNKEITGDIIKHWQSHAHGRKTIVFAASVAHSKNIVTEFLAVGISARHLDANSPAELRDQTLSDWRDGKFHVLSNMGLFIEGLDVPAASCVILARPTKSLTIYLQAVGRVMRTHADKTDCIVLDHAGLTLIHNLVDAPREWTLDGKEKAKRDDTPAVAVTVCEHCFCTYSKADNPDFCPECLTDHVKPAPPKVHADGELIELTAEAMLAIKAASKAKWVAEMKAAKTESQLIELGISRGYKHAAGWAGHIMKQRNEWRASRG